MKKKILAGILCAVSLFPMTVHADLMNYEAADNVYKQDNQKAARYEISDGGAGMVQVLAWSDTVYVSVQETALYAQPGEQAKAVGTAILGTALNRVGVCDNGWSKVRLEGDSALIGYVPDTALSDHTGLEEVSETVTVLADSDILSFPGRKDGEVVGTLLEQEQVVRTGKINDVWSRVTYTDMEGQEQTGYVATSALDVQEATGSDVTETVEDGETIEAGVISESKGQGIFADAVEEINGGISRENGVQIGEAVPVSSDANLIYLGNFRITHYCPCSICCGPWADGITSTGVTATTNHTIAVDPTQIPYGSQVVINGQVYVAEDCGGAIKTNCIDIYVASHEEGESKGVYYTEVYLIQ